MLNFDFLEKGLKIASPPHFVYDFSIFYDCCNICVRNSFVNQTFC